MFTCQPFPNFTQPSGHVDPRRITVLEVSSTSADLEHAFKRIDRRVGTGNRPIAVCVESSDRLPQLAVPIVLVGSGDEPPFGIDLQNPFWNSHSAAANPLVPAERLGIRFDYVELAHLPDLGAHGAMIVESARFGSNILRVY